MPKIFKKKMIVIYSPFETINEKKNFPKQITEKKWQEFLKKQEELDRWSNNLKDYMEYNHGNPEKKRNVMVVKHRDKNTRDILSRLKETDEIYIHAHGDIEEVSTNSSYTLSPKKLTKRLIEDGLPKNTPTLKGWHCHSGDTNKDFTEPYVERVGEQLQKENYTGRIFGYKNKILVFDSKEEAYVAKKKQVDRFEKKKTPEGKIVKKRISSSRAKNRRVVYYF